MLLVQFIYYFLICIIAIPVFVVLLQVVLAVLMRKVKSYSLPAGFKKNITVIIPAHNESSSIIPTLISLKKQTLTTIAVLVVADNCDDDTAQVVRDSGISVIERSNLNLRGKGYALDFGIKYLSKQTASDYIVVVDADCVLQQDAIEQLIYQAEISLRPVQANYLMQSPKNASIKIKIAEFAWMLKNFVRPLGYMRIGMPCQLTGSGMAFPWQLISQINFATGHIVEDMKLGLDFAEIGAAPIFCPSAIVYSQFPVNDEGINTQRTRWEHGHLGIIFKDVPQVLSKSISNKNLHLFAMGIDLLVPPLSLMAMLLVLVLFIGLVLSVMSSALAPLLFQAGAVFSIFVFTIMLFWAIYGHKVISIAELMSIPYYIILKLPIYIKFIFHRQSEWVRSKRD